MGDKFPRRDLIRAVLEPSAEIAVGYGTTIVETKSGEAYLGILKEVTAEALELMGADGKQVRIATSDIQEQRGSTISLMPDGLQAGLCRPGVTPFVQVLAPRSTPGYPLTEHRPI